MERLFYAWVKGWQQQKPIWLHPSSDCPHGSSAAVGWKRPAVQMLWFPAVTQTLT